PSFFRFHRKLQRRIAQQFLVTLSDPPSFTRPIVQVTEFDPKDRSLNAFHSVVEPDFIMIIPARGTVIAQCAGAGSQSLIVGQQSPAFSVSPEVFSRIEAETRHAPESANDSPPISRAMRLSGV